MSYDPLTDDILVAIQAAQTRAQNARLADGTFPLEHLLSGFDLHPKIVSALISEQVENHAGRLEAGAELETALTSLFVGGLLIGLYVGEVRDGRRLAERGVA